MPWRVHGLAAHRSCTAANVSSLAMKRILVGITTVASLLSMNAFAADLLPRTYTKTPMMVDPGFNWSGFYVGGNVGYSWGSSATPKQSQD